VNNILLGLGSNRGEGSGGGGGGDEPTYLEIALSDLEEEYEEHGNMAYQNMEWMTQGPLSL